MKKFIILFLFFIFLGCNERGYISPIGNILQGSHELRKIQTKESNNFKLSGSFFIGTGSINAESKIQEMVMFSWKDNENNYVISKLPLTKFKVRIDNSFNIPYIKFRWSSFPNNKNMQTIMEMNVIYVLLYCSEKDYPKNLNFTNF